MVAEISIRNRSLDKRQQISDKMDKRVCLKGESPPIKNGDATQPARPEPLARRNFLPPEALRITPPANAKRMHAHPTGLIRRGVPIVRTCKPLTIIALGFLILSPSLFAAPPSLAGSSPSGLIRGRATELTFQGGSLVGTPEILSALPLQYTKSENKDAGKWTVKLTLPADAPLGVFPVRIVTAKGVSNPILLAVDQVPTVMEVEPNTKFETAQAVPAPIVVEGSCANNDVDFYKFPGRKGQQVVVDAAAARIGSALDPSIRISLARGKKFLASADDTPGLATDARIITTLPEDGDYVVELEDSNYKGTGPAKYRLTIGTLPLAEEVFPPVLNAGATNAIELRGGTVAKPGEVVRLAAVPRALLPYGLVSLPIPATAIGAASAAFDATAQIQWPYPLLESDLPQVLESDTPPAKKPSAPVAFLGRIEKPNDEDKFDVAVDAGAKYRVKVEANRIGSALDGVLKVMNAAGGQIATADDSPLKLINPPPNTPPITQPDPELEFTVPAGQSSVSLVIGDISKRGGLGYHYRITIEKSVPGFDLNLASGQSSVPVGQNTLVNLTVDRARGYAGLIRLELENPPAGVKFRPGFIPSGGTAGNVSISLDTGAKLPPTFLRIVGKGDGGVTARAVSATIFASQGTLPVNVLNQDGLMASGAEATPVGLTTPETAVELAQGFEGTFPLKLARTAGGEPALELALVNPPKGVTLAANKVAEKVGDFAVVLKSTTETPVGEHSIGLTAKGKLAGEDRVVDAPLVKLAVVAPIVLEGVTKELSIKPGQTVELKGKLNRKPSAKTEVTLTIDTLPAGLKAEPVKVAGDKAEFTLKIVADKAAKAATGNAVVKAAFKASDNKDFPPLTAPVAVKIVP